MNGRRLTNIGTLRAYILTYLKNHPNINKDMTIMVRQLAPDEYGIPLWDILLYFYNSLGWLWKYTIRYFWSYLFYFARIWYKTISIWIKYIIENIFNYILKFKKWKVTYLKTQN